MKKLFLSVTLAISSLVSFAQDKVTIEAGTQIPLQVVNATKAADISVGQSVEFRVAKNIKVKGETVIPYGTKVNGKVYEAKKSSWFGTKGRLGININEIVMPDGTLIPLRDGNVYVTGQNRTALSVILFLFVTIPACFIPGTRAEIANGYEIQAAVASDTEVISGQK